MGSIGGRKRGGGDERRRRANGTRGSGRDLGRFRKRKSFVGGFVGIAVKLGKFQEFAGWGRGGDREDGEAGGAG